MNNIPDTGTVFPNVYKTSCFLKNVITAPNIFVGDYTYYDDPTDPTGFERNNVLFNWPEFGDRLIIGKFCSLASGVQFIMGSANHRISSISTYPFHVFGGAWEENTPPHLSQLPFKGDTVVGNDVWIGRESVIMPGVHIGDGAIIAGYGRPFPGRPFFSDPDFYRQAFKNVEFYLVISGKRHIIVYYTGRVGTHV